MTQDLRHPEEREGFPQPHVSAASRETIGLPAFPAGGNFRYQPQPAAAALSAAPAFPVAAAHAWSGPVQATALVHDYLAQSGGAERVVAALHALFPAAPLYTSVYDPDGAVDRVR